MNSLPNQPGKPAATGRSASRKAKMKSPVRLAEEEATHRHVAMEKDLENRANAMTALLAGIMDRPATRHWGLNE